ncbi:MAG: winged helix-turn-helix domain-containing protein [Pseudomonadota bacterium]|nr:winged helix-turn-helix domain-containing protein [Pseudomonadota bacterium]
MRLQPRVMQVLVALARANGEVVSREALVDSCWSGLSVGEDALSRSIQTLRRSVETEAAGAFTVETIPKIGYRLARRPEPGLTPKSVQSKGGNRNVSWIAMIGALAVVAVAITAIFVLEARPARWAVERSEHLVSTPWAERHPAISPDGTTLAYSAGPDIASRRIYLKRLSGGQSIRLTEGPFDDAGPVWSPNGARIAYVAARAGEPCRIMVITVRAGLAREVGRCQGAERSRAVWSPAGDALMFSDAVTSTAAARIVRLDLATGARRTITHPPGGRDDQEPAISPDGRWVAFTRSSPETRSLVTIHDLRGGRERIVANLEEGEGGFAWSEDSKDLFVADGNGVESTLWAYPIVGGGRTLVAVLPLEVGRVASGPGGLLAAEITSARFNLMRPPAPGQAGPMVADSANGHSWSPAFAPDGTLALASDRTGENAIWLAPPGGVSRSFLSWGAGYVIGLSWSPDGAALAFVRLAGGGIALHVVSRGGRDLATIPVSAVEVGQPAWRADGRSLLFPARDGHGWRLWRADLSRPEKPYPITGVGWIAVRTWGDRLFGVKVGQPGIWRLGPQPNLIVAGFSTRSPDQWTIFKDRIVFADGNYPNPKQLLSAPVAGGRERPFADTPRAMHDQGFAIDPRSGQTIYIGVVDFDTDIELFHLVRK